MLFEKLKDFSSPFTGPVLFGFNSRAIVASQKLGKLIRRDLRFVVVGVVLKRFGFIVDRHGDQNKQNGLEDFHDQLEGWV